MPAAYPRVPPWAEMERPFGLRGRTGTCRDSQLSALFLLDAARRADKLEGMIGNGAETWGKLVNEKRADWPPDQLTRHEYGDNELCRHCGRG